MYTGKTVFAQLMKFMPEYEFQKCVDHYQGDYRVRKLTCREHFLVMSFAQLTGRESLRDIENCLDCFLWQVVSLRHQQTYLQIYPC